jgi:NAD(P)-dependent dehydrogenase (short-subunit alcohol dehydrogenase family)
VILKDKVVMVSGIGRGLGIKIALNAAREGARVVGVSCRTPAMLDEAQARIREVAPGCRVIKVKADLTSIADGEAFAAAVTAEGGRIDALINSGRFSGDQQKSWDDNILTTDFSDWEPQFAVNCVGFLKMSRAVVPQMRKQGGGSIVMVNTNAARAGGPGTVHGYAASKAALMNASQALARVVGPDNIRVNSIFPSWMWNEPVIDSIKKHPEMGTLDQVYKAVAAGTALKRVMTDDEVSLAALFLASDYSVSMTGAMLDTNGGEWMP